ncbi:hypothetical protein ACOSOMT5_P0035 [Acidiphilium sp. MT5]
MSLDDGRIELDTNMVEREIHRITATQGKKNSGIDRPTDHRRSRRGLGREGDRVRHMGRLHARWIGCLGLRHYSARSMNAWPLCET